MTMRDDQNQELISAYLDGEVTAEERRQAEQLLASSPEHRQFLDQLRRQQAALRGIPSPKLAFDVSRRVVAAVERARGNQPEPVVVGGPEPRGSGWRSWQALAVVVGTAAALLLLAIYFSSPNRNGGPRPNELVGPETHIEVPRPPEVVVPPESPAVDEPLSSETLVALNEFQQLVQLVVIFDFTVTLEGQQQKLIPAWMAKNGIPLNRGIPVDRKLEQQILGARFVGDNKIAVANGQPGQPQVEMLFVRGTLKQLDGVWRDYVTVRARPNPPVRFRMDVAMAPRELNIFLQLNRATGLDVAEMKADPQQLRLAEAFPLQFQQRLRSLTATQATNSLALRGNWDRPEKARQAGGSPVRFASADSHLAVADTPFAVAQTGNEVAQDAPIVSPLAGWNDPEQPGQAIFIIRNEPADAGR